VKKNFFGRISLIALAVLLSIIYYLPSTSLHGSLPEWLQKYGIVLGLDLQGGVHLVYEVDGEKAVEITAERIASRLSNFFKEEKLEANAVIENMDIIVSSADNKVSKAVADQFPILIEFTRTDEKIVYRLSDDEIKTIRNRVDQFGVSEPTIHKQGQNELVIQLPGVKDTRRAIDLVGKTAILEFKVLDEESPVAAQLPLNIQTQDEEDIIKQYADQIPEDDEILFGRLKNAETGIETKTSYLVKKQSLLTGEFLTEARVNISQQFNEPYVSISFDSTGAKIFDQVTNDNKGKRLAIILDNNVYSAPTIRDRISGGNAMIEGRFTLQEARDLAIVLRSGSLPAPLTMLQNITVGPSLGRDSIEAGINAGLIGAFLVIVFMIVYYKVSGVIADFALLLNIICLIGALSAFNATLTLPGIAGIILAVGMAVDSNVLMFERIREELRVGKTPRAAIDSGYDKAFWTIFDSHVTTLITAVVLFQFGTGPIKGFAVTLGLGVFINLFTALIGTKTVFDLMTSKWEIKRLSI
jgi:preprotein translocase subunit SecD